ncbi:MAG: RnfABCDGE type electron transport complex subunit C [Methanosarcinales archaeon Met12]|nr:MAG: RnfABCDGE type electron transport complex subunit C [Methanosarcinales archaeon Met12]
MKQITSIAKIPEKVTIPLQQHVGVENRSLVIVGDVVKVGQKIGESESGISPVHSSVSGKVIEISKHPHPFYENTPTIIIEPNGKDSSIEFKAKDYSRQGREQIIEIIKEAGIVESGIPVHTKLNLSDVVILNGMDEPPYVAMNHALMLDFPDEIIEGLKILMKATGASRGLIGIDIRDSDVINRMNRAVVDDSNIGTVSLKTTYVQGMEGLFAKAVVRKELSHGQQISNASTMTVTVGTAKVVYDAVCTGKPMIETVITVLGTKKSQNVLVKIGTPVRDVIRHCGGYSGEPKKIIINGPMTGMAQYTDEVPIVKGTYGVFVQYEGDVSTVEPGPCINCAKCIDVCPVNLLPNMLVAFAGDARFDMCENYNISACVECGKCAYVCPSKIPIVQLIKYAKGWIK